MNQKLEIMNITVHALIPDYIFNRGIIVLRRLQQAIIFDKINMYHI
jgi:hypothetical protein